MQTSQKLEITTPANENQADFPRKDTKIDTPEFTPDVSSLAFLSGARDPPSSRIQHPASKVEHFSIKNADTSEQKLKFLNNF